MKAPKKARNKNISLPLLKPEKKSLFELPEHSFFLNALNRISSPVLIINDSEKIIFTNKAVKKFFGSSIKLCNKKYSTLLKDKNSRKEYKTAVNDLLQKGKRSKRIQLKYTSDYTDFVETHFVKIKSPDKEKYFLLVELDSSTVLDLKTNLNNYRWEYEKLSAELNRKEDENDFRSLIENSRDVIMRFDKDFRHLFVNYEIKRQLGISPETMIGKTHKELGFPEELIEIWEPALQKVFETGKENRIEFQLPNGIWIDWLIIPEFDSKGNVTTVITFARDITKIKEYEDEIEALNKSLKQKVQAQTRELIEQNKLLKKEITRRKKEQEKLEKSERKFRDLFELSASGILVIDTEGKILEVNQRFSKIIGYSKEELLKMSVFDFSYSGSDYEARKNLKLLREGKLLHHTVRNITKNNELIYLELYEKMIEDEEGNEKIFITVNDITERIKGEIKIAQKDLMYRSLFNYSPTGIILEDSKGYIIEVNDALCKSLGYTKEELIGKHVSFLAPANKEEFVANNINSIMSGKVLQHRVESLRKDGKIRIFELNEIKIPLGEGEEGILAISKDVSELVEREQNLIKAREAAEKAMRFKTEFFAQMSHEIRSPINLILGYISLLREDLEGEELNEIRQASFKGIESAGQRILKTIESILNISEMEAGLFEPKFKQINMSAILDDLSKEYGHYAEIHGLDFVFENKAENAIVRADEYSATQIISNLLDNAIKYTKKGTVTLRALNEKNLLKIQVEDTGIGISEEFLPKLFDAFERESSEGENRKKGTGLGLALVKKYCEVNNAQIEVESKKGVGSKFTVSFKVA